MQKKFTIKKNTLKMTKKNGGSAEVKSSSIERKSDFDGFRINIITSAGFDTSNLDRLVSPIEAERLKQQRGMVSEKKRRRAVKNLSLKPAPPVPTAPKDEITINKNRLVSEIRSLLSRVDLVFVILSLVLACLGLIAIHSATLTFDSPRFVIVQSCAICLGLAISVLLSLIDYRSFSSKYRYIIAANAMLLLLTYIFGSSVTESTNANWIDLGFIKIQPSEFAKLLFIYSFAVHLSYVREKMHKFSTVISLGIHAALIFGLVLLQKDLGSLTIFFIIFICMCFAAGISIWYYIGGGVIVALASPFIWARLNEYQKNRILLCFDSSIDPAGEGIRYQQLRSQIAIGNGRVFGTGYTEGTVTQGLTNHLPAKHTDMIFSTFCEEFGLIGAIILLSITTIFVIRIIRTALNCGNPIGSYICVGIASMFMIQIIENVGMCLGIMPVIGITYPFLSYGGSSVLSCFIAVGIVLSVCTHKEKTFFD